jgi:hypothetical protein
VKVDENLILAEMRKVPRRAEKLPSLSFFLLADQVTLAEKILLVALLEKQWCAAALDQLEPQLFEGLHTEPIFEKIFQLQKENSAISTVRLRELVSDDSNRDLIEGLALRSGELLLSDEAIKNSVQALQKKQYERLSLQLQEEIKKEETENSRSSAIDQLLVRKEQIRKKMKAADQIQPNQGE